MHVLFYLDDTKGHSIFVEDGGPTQSKLGILPQTCIKSGRVGCGCSRIGAGAGACQQCDY